MPSATQTSQPTIARNPGSRLCVRLRACADLRHPGIAYALCLLALTLVACGKPFTVQPGPDKPIPPLDAKAENQTASLEAEAVTDEDYLYDTFEANLIAAGVLPVRILLTNRSAAPLDLRKVEFQLKTPEPRTYKFVDGRKAFKRVFQYYDITFYSKDGYQQSANDFTAHAFDIQSPLLAGESRHGLVFFLLPEEATQLRGLIFVARRLDTAEKKSAAGLELKLN